MKKIISLIVICVIGYKLSPVIMLLVMYIGMYFLAERDPQLKSEMNEHQIEMINMIEDYAHNALQAFPVSTLISYTFYFACIIAVFYGVKMVIREVKNQERVAEELDA